MKATLSNYRQSPRKVRLVADLIRGKSVDEALLVLDQTTKRATSQLKKLILSAVANAKSNEGMAQDTLMIKEIRVDEGPTLKRFNPVSRGMAHPINKRTSHVTITLDTTKKK